MAQATLLTRSLENVNAPIAATDRFNSLPPSRRSSAVSPIGVGLAGLVRLALGPECNVILPQKSATASEPNGQRPIPTPRKRWSEDGTRFRQQLAGGSTQTTSDRTRLIDYTALQDVSEEDVGDLDRLAYLAIKYDAEVKKSEGYHMEIAK